MTSAPIPTGRPRQRILLGIGLRVGAVAAMSVMFAMAKWAGEQGVPLFEIVLFRHAFAFLPLFFYIWRTTGFSVLRTHNPRAHMIRSAMGLTGMVCGFAALGLMPLTEATALQFTAPLFMIALSALVLREPVGPHRWGAVAVGFVGVMIIIQPDPGHITPTGAALSIAAAMGSAGAMMTIRKMGATEAGSTIVFYFTVMGVLLGLVGSAFHWVVPDPVTLMVLIGCGVVGGVCQMLLTEALRVAPLGVVAPFDYTQMLFALGIGFLVWGELPRHTTVVGGLVVAASGLYILHREIRAFRRPT